MRTGNVGLLSRLGLLRSRITPDWADSKIDSELFIYNEKQQQKPLVLPKGIQQKFVQTPAGSIAAYYIGQGPVVMFVHDWGGSAQQFFPLMRALKECGYTAIAFDHLGHGDSETRQATLKQMISTTNLMVNAASKSHRDGLCCVVAHGLGGMVVTNISDELLQDLPLFLIAPSFNYKLLFLKKLSKLKLHPNLLKPYAEQFVKHYKRNFQKMELASRLKVHAENTVIVHDNDDVVAPVSETVNFGKSNPLTRLVFTSGLDHDRVIISESVWQELKSHINYEDTSINFSNIKVGDKH